MGKGKKKGHRDGPGRPRKGLGKWFSRRSSEAKPRRGGGVIEVSAHQNNQKALPPPAKPVELTQAQLDAFAAAMVDARPTPLQAPLDLHTLTRPRTIVLDGGGLWEIRRNQIGVFVKHMGGSLPGYPTFMQGGLLLKAEPLPWGLFTQIVAFFREVNDKHKTEAYVQVWIDAQTGEHYLHVPTQDVSGGKVDHIGDHDEFPDGSRIHLMDIHSHHTMGAFFSQTDDNDERRHDRLYGVIGQIDKKVPASKWRAAVGGTFIDLQMAQCVEIPAEEITHTFTTTVADLLAGKGGADRYYFEVDPFRDAGFPAEWMEQLITTRKQSWSSGFQGGHTNVYGKGRGSSAASPFPTVTDRRGTGTGTPPSPPRNGGSGTGTTGTDSTGAYGTRGSLAPGRRLYTIEAGILWVKEWKPEGYWVDRPLGEASAELIKEIEEGGGEWPQSKR